MTKTAVLQDGGWGWVIVFVAFVITFLSFGTAYSIGIIFDDLIEEFNCTKSEVSIIASILFSLQCFLGPLVSLLQQRFEDKKIVMVGCLLITISFVSSSFAPDVEYLYFTLGVLAGIGSAMVYMPLVVLISFYFSRRRSIATALGCLGGHVGSFVHPYLIRLLVAFYDWRGALLIIGALILNSLALAILLRPFNLKERLKLTNKSGKYSENAEDANLKLEAFTSNCEAPSNQQNNSAELCPVAETLDEFESTVSANDTGGCMTPQRYESVCSTHSSLRPKLRRVLSVPKRSYSFFRQLSEKVEVSLSPFSKMKKRQTSVPSFDKQLVIMGDISLTSPGTPDRTRCSHKVSQILKKSPSTTRLTGFSSAVGSSILSIPIIFDPVLAPASIFNFLSEESELPPLARIESDSASANVECGVVTAVELKDGDTEQDEKSASKHDIDVFMSLPTTLNAASLNVSLASSLDNLPPAKPVKKRENHCWSMIKPFFRHFSNSGFSAFVASNFLLCLAYYTPSVFIVHWGNELGMSSDKTTLLLSLIGMGNIVGRPIFSFTADRWVHFRIPLFALMIGIAGSVTTITPLLPNFYFLAFFVFQFGFLAGASQTLLTPILADMVPLCELSNAFGVLILVDGIALLIGPPLLAMLPSYDYTFAISGIIIMTSSLVLIAPAYVNHFFPTFKAIGSKCRKQQKDSTDLEMPK